MTSGTFVADSAHMMYLFVSGVFKRSSQRQVGRLLQVDGAHILVVNT